MTDKEQLTQVKEEFVSNVKKLRDTIEEKTDAQIKTAIEKFTSDTEKQFDTFREEQGKIAVENQKLIKAVEKLQGKLDNYYKREVNDPKEQKQQFQRLAEDWLRKGTGETKGKIAYQPQFIDETKATSIIATDEGATGGYMKLPAVFSSKIQEALLEISPIRQNARVETIVGDSWEEPEVTGSFQELDVEERTTRTTTTVQDWGKIVIYTHIRSAEPKITLKMLRMARIDMEAWIRQGVAKYFAKGENTDFLTGDGETQPVGILSAVGKAASITDVNSGVADNLPADMDTFHDVWKNVKGGYGDKKWYMRRATIAEVFKYKNGEGKYLLQANIDRAFPFMIIGDPIVETPDMPAIAANAYPIMYGDLKAAYVVVDNPGMIMIRDEVTTKGFVLFYFEKSTGGGVVQPEAIVRLKCST